MDILEDKYYHQLRNNLKCNLNKKISSSKSSMEIDKSYKKHWQLKYKYLKDSYSNTVQDSLCLMHLNIYNSHCCMYKHSKHLEYIKLSSYIVCIQIMNIKCKGNCNDKLIILLTEGLKLSIHLTKKLIYSMWQLLKMLQFQLIDNTFKQNLKHNKHNLDQKQMNLYFKQHKYLIIER